MVNHFFAQTAVLPPPAEIQRRHSYPQFFQSPVNVVQVIVNLTPAEQLIKDLADQKAHLEKLALEDKSKTAEGCCNKLASCCGAFINKIICGR